MSSTTRRPEPPADISSTVRRALSEDVGSGDLTAELLPAEAIAGARVICREQAILCGRPWFTATYTRLSPDVVIDWNFSDGDSIESDNTVCTVQGPVRMILTGERTALNFLQLLSGTATFTARMVQKLGSSSTRLLDTRKTIPGLRTAQKYAVLCGGGSNHRMGLYDAILIKENHIRASGSIGAAVHRAKESHRQVEVEVESLPQLDEAITAGADMVMLDNFSLDMVREAVKLSGGRTILEVSGDVSADNLADIAATGVDCISMGALTKNIRAIDFTLLVD